ncbi:hypothetical protein C9J44_05010 [Photobacterium sp. GB-27]|nr:hypothetical protein C9J44_05010 [Photobacterium sp. GB-27]
MDNIVRSSCPIWNHLPIPVGNSRLFEYTKIIFYVCRKHIKQMQAQFDKWLKAKEAHDERQLKRQKNRLLKIYEELKAKSTSPAQKENINKIKTEII